MNCMSFNNHIQTKIFFTGHTFIMRWRGLVYTPVIEWRVFNGILGICLISWNPYISFSFCCILCCSCCTCRMISKMLCLKVILIFYNLSSIFLTSLECNISRSSNILLSFFVTFICIVIDSNSLSHCEESNNTKCKSHFYNIYYNL